MARLKTLVPITPETTVLPEQFRLQAKTDAFLPAKRLMVAVLERALGEYETSAARTDWRGRRQFAEVEAWFASDNTDWPFSFVAICEALSLDVPSVRASESATRRLDVWRSEQPAGLEQPEHAFG